MLVYNSKKINFLVDVDTNNIEGIIENEYFQKTGKYVSQSQLKSWKYSLRKMRDVINTHEIPDEVGISVEYTIPQSSKRIDFIITGQNEKEVPHVIIVELKQWSNPAKLSKKDAVLNVDFYSGEVTHPSYQAWSYASLLENFNQTVNEKNIQLKPCAYLHNYIPDQVISNAFYSEYIKKAPLFLEGDMEKLKLRNFILKYVKYGDKSNIMYHIDNGRIKPSKSLADSLVKMLKGNSEFIMIDEQKVVYETAKNLAKSTDKNKSVYIVHGGPGTGKTVVAINLLVDLLKIGLNARYVTKNAAPRDVYESKLTGTLKKTEISNLFMGSGSFYNTKENTFDVLIIDETHRLNEKSGLFKNKGENQVKELIKSSKCTIFFLDEDQKVTWKDIGHSQEINKFAGQMKANIYSDTLSSQFRCNGSDGYIAWLDDVLQIKETANYTFEKDSFDFRIYDSPVNLRDEIFEKNKINNKARIVAGYCWDWVSKKNKNSFDIKIPEYNFEMKWNLADYGNRWIIDPNSANEVGCIHTCQGLETDYIGVIIGDDLIVRDNKVITIPKNRAKTDNSIKGYQKDLKTNHTSANKKADEIIKNTYKTLMTRGMKGCYIYCTDKETQEYFSRRFKM